MVRSRSRLFVATVVAALGLAGAGAQSAAAAHVDAAVDWNHNMLQAFAIANVPPPAANRLGAIVQSAVFDAVNGIERRYTPIHVEPAAPADASPNAAAASAAHEALVKLFPTQAPALDAELEASLQDVGDPGVGWGKAVADEILAWRSTDGFGATPPQYVFSTAAGQWRPTPGGSGAPKFRTLATTTPFALTSPSQFRPSGPPALTSALFLHDLAEVQSVGGLTSSTRTPYETETARFWQINDTPVGMWDRLTDDLAVANHFNLMRTARLLAQVNIAIADATIAVFDAKNAYNFWRPVTAINLTSDPAWQPLMTTPYFQEYPSAHSGTSSAATAVLADVFGNDTTFTMTSAGLPGVTRTFNSFSDAVAQVADARVFAGFHFRFSCDDAITMGNEIGAYVVRHVMLPAED